MKHILTSFIFVITCVAPFVSWSQQGQLRVDISSYSFYDDSTCYELSVFNNQDTVYVYKIDDPDDLEWLDIKIDSLRPGMYFVNLTNCGLPSDELVQSITKVVEIRPDEVAELYFELSEYVSYNELDEETQEEIIRDRIETQLEFSYFDFRWNPNGNDPKFNVGSAISTSAWFSFSKHVGFLVGGGLGWTFAPLQNDQETNANYPDEVKLNYYNYVYARYDMKLRFSTLNQQQVKIRAHNVLFDIGVLYNLPLYFKRVTRFNVQDKLVNSFIHHYSDARVYVNLGIANFQFFAEYRPFDFIGKEYPEFPKYNVGVKFNVHY